LQAVKYFGDIKKNEWLNMLIFGENLQALKYLLKLKNEGILKNQDGTKGFKLIYIDPPFGTGDIYDARGESPAYSARLQGVNYIEFLRKRLIFLKELLSDDGCIFIRIDYHFGHYIKIIMDEIFDKNNFRNEFIVNRGQSKAGFFKQFDKIKSVAVSYDTIFWYSNLANTRFTKIKKGAPEEDREHGKWMNLIKAKAYDRPTMKYEILGINKDAPWMWSKERAFKAVGNFNEFLKISKDTNESLEEYWIKTEKQFEFVRRNVNQIQYWIPPRDEVLVDNNWLDIKGYSHLTNYPTENSEELLDRILQVTKEGDLVLDCFAGSGTTGAIAEKLGRRWIMVDCGKLSIYTIQKRLMTLKEEIGDKGKPLKHKPFVLYNAGLYQDGELIDQMQEDVYKDFVLELFGCQKRIHELNGIEMDGTLNNHSVMIFNKKHYLTYEFIEDLHKHIGTSIKNTLYIIAPVGIVGFNEDIISRGNVKYNILRIPNSIIEQIKDKNFVRLKQPRSLDEINQTIDSIGFDFIYPPRLKVEYYQCKPRDKLIDKEYVIEIKEFEPVQLGSKIIEFKDAKSESLAMVMIDFDYNGDTFNLDRYYFGNDIIKSNFVIKIDDEIGEKLMIVYLDIFGNERKEVILKKDFTER